MKKLTIYLMLLFVASFAFAQTSTWDGSAASWTQGSGTSSSPYLIESAQNLAYLAEMVNGGVNQYSGKYFKLTTDINLNNLAWSPIGDKNTSSAIFKGNFDGDNHKITKLKINSSTLTLGGLFGAVSGSTLCNINVSGIIQISTSSSYVGGIAGSVSGTVVFDNCNSSVSISGSGYYVGGLIGGCPTNSNNNVTISNCRNYGSMSGRNVGGIIGSTGASSSTTITISSCSNFGDVSAAYWGGGIIGNMANSGGTITLCANTGTISSSITTSSYGTSSNHLNLKPCSGGIVGRSEDASNTIEISLCYNKGPVSSYIKTTGDAYYTYCYSYSGGIVGKSNESGTRLTNIRNCYNRGNVTATSTYLANHTAPYESYEYASGIGNYSKNFNCYNTGTIVAPTDACSNVYKYGIGNGTTTNCHYLSSCGASGNGTSKTEAVMKSESFPAVLNSEVFIMDATPNVNDGYPIFGANFYITTGTATNVSYTSAKLNGWYNVGTSYSNPPDMQGFEYKKTSASSWTTVYVNVGTPASHNLTGLTNGTNYQCRMFVKFGNITIYGNTVEFTTTACNATVSIASGTTQICDNSSVTLTASATSSGSISSYAWSNSSTTRAITVRSAGTYKVTVTDQYGCTATASCAMTSIAAPTASISGNSYVCSGNNTTLTASGGVGYVWSTGATTPSINVSNAGTYSVIARASNNCTDTAYINITAFDDVSISGNTTICAGGSTTLTVSGGSSYRWSTGATTRSITVTNEGLYSVTATSGQCSANASVYVTVNSLPNVSISGNTTICGGASTTLTANGGTSYTWSNNATSQSINVSAAGTYKVTATNANGCTASVSASVVAASNPTPQITGNLTACEGETVTLAANGGTSYSWSNGSTNASISVTSGGTYTVVASNNAGCTASTNATVTINGRPTPVISGNLSICDGESTTLSVNGGDSFVWNNGSTSANINVTSSGNYSVVASNSNGCTASASATVNVMQNPTVTISGEVSICVGETANLNAEGGVSYVWSNGSHNQSINVSDAGTYSVVTTDANGCTSSASIVVTQNSLPEVSISGQQTICSGSSATLLAGGGTSYLWNNGYTEASISVTTGGTYIVVVGNSAGCTASASATVVVNETPTPVISGNLSICDGESTTLSVNGGDSFVWSNGSASESINVTSSGTYSVVVSNSNGCTASASVSVNILENPIVTISGNSSICDGGVTTLTAEGGNSYLWSTGFPGASINVSEAGTYSVIAIGANGCTSSAELVVVRYSVPEVSITGNTTVCEGSSTTITANGGVSYQWSTGETGASINVNAFGIYSVTATGNGGCTATTNATVFVSSAPTPSISGNMHICDNETTTLTANGGDSYMWSNGSTGNSINVSNGGTYSVIATNESGCTAMVSANVEAGYSVTNSITENVETDFTWNGHTYNEPGDYTQIFTAANGCDSIVTLHLNILSGISQNSVFEIALFPNPVNDILNITSSETISEIEIVNVMGQVVKRIEVNSDNAVCDVEDLTSGVYIVRIHGMNTELVICQRKFVKE